MWDMVEQALVVNGKRLDFMTTDGFRLNSAVWILINLAHARPEVIALQRVMEAAYRYTLYINDWNIRIGNPIYKWGSNSIIRCTRGDLFENADHAAYIPSVGRGAFPDSLLAPHRRACGLHCYLLLQWEADSPF